MSALELQRSDQQAPDPGGWDRADPAAARRAIRSGAFAGYTAGVAPGCVQANVCIPPRAYAEDFLLYCQRNPKPCPLLARSDPGEPRLPALAGDLDIRTANCGLTPQLAVAMRSHHCASRTRRPRG